MTKKKVSMSTHHISQTQPEEDALDEFEEEDDDDAVLRFLSVTTRLFLRFPPDCSAASIWAARSAC